MGAAWRDTVGRKTNFNQILEYVKEIRYVLSNFTFYILYACCSMLPCGFLSVYFCLVDSLNIPTFFSIFKRTQQMSAARLCIVMRHSLNVINDTGRWAWRCAALWAC